EIREIRSLGIQSVLLFGIPATKDATGSGGTDTNGVIQVAIREIKSVDPDLIVMTDVCLCDYTDHGHCGVIEGSNIDNDATLTILQQMAESHAKNGADVVAPSAMMDGQVGAIRSALDSAGKKDTVIMGYSSKYASGFYGPFRVAAQSAPQFGNRSSYQADPANVRQAMLEIQQDIEEGADIIMVKPALAYLDVIRTARERFDLPLAAYNVSGEYSMVKAASANDWIEGDRVRDEILTSIKRAGADIIISYHAKEIASTL
ncbi:MAG: porphobilinogen synthase, partial [Chloroflexota bacterium]|nr:porphobilinogen synthase [Chloroflexota bacterium]